MANKNDFGTSTTTRKSSRKSQTSDSKKTIGFNLKENYQTKENHNNRPNTNKEYFNELNTSFDNLLT